MPSRPLGFHLLNDLRKYGSADSLIAALAYFASVATRPLRPLGHIPTPSTMCRYCHHTTPPESFCRFCGAYRNEE